MERLEELHKREGELFDELKRSLAIKKLWPEVFDKGKIDVSFYGGTTYDLQRGKVNKMKMVLKRSDGDSREFTLDKVPIMLWPEWVVDHVPSMFRSSIEAKQTLEV
jgi:hypothetical protein